MELPTWFGQDEFYIILYTIWFFLIIWLIINLIKAITYIRSTDTKDGINKIKEWFEKRKTKKGEKEYERKKEESMRRL